MPDRSPLFIPSPTFLISAISVFAAPAFTLMACPPPIVIERNPPPAVPDLLKQNEALAAAAGALNREGFDLSVMEVLITDDNALWPWHVGSNQSDLAPDLRDALSRDPYWAVYFRPRPTPGFSILDGDMWVFVRRSDLKVIGRR
jgi:hypothetical protein